jgi:competence protein ComEA
VKRALDSELTRRMLPSMALLLLAPGLIALAIFPLSSVSARQAAPAPANQNNTYDPQAAHPEFPAGEGREAVFRLCTKCHSPTIVLAYGQKREGWENTITKMVRLGAVGSDEDFTDIADYLTTNFPPSSIQKLFVNKATDQQLAAILEISPDDAKAIAAYRDKVGGFKSIDDMKKVPNVDTKKIDAKKDNLVF